MLKFTQRATLIIILTITFSTRAYSTEQLIPEDYNQFSSATYNALPAVEDADVMVKANGNLSNLLNATKNLVEEYAPELLNYLGFRLIHKHILIEDNHAMVERCKEIDRSPAFITSSQQLLSEKDVYPASWLSSKQGALVFEYAIDQEVMKGFSLLMHNRQLIEGIFTTLTELNLENLLAPALLKREQHSAINFDEVKFVERTYLKPKAMSVVTSEDPKNVNPLTLIQTSWGLQDGLITNTCQLVIYCFFGDNDFPGHEKDVEHWSTNE